MRAEQNAVENGEWKKGSERREKKKKKQAARKTAMSDIR
jgi:hypothetical protein